MRIFAAFIAIFSTSSALVADDSQNAEFHNRLRAGVMSLFEMDCSSTEYKLKTEISHQGVVNGKAFSDAIETQCHVSRSSANMLLAVDERKSSKSPNPIKLGSLICVNGDYAFGITKGRSANSWGLATFSRSRKDAVFLEQVGAKRAVLYPLTTLGSEESLIDYMNGDTFRITSLRNLPEGLVEAGFSLDAVGKSGKDREGKIIVNTTQNYVPVEYSHQIKTPRPVLYRLTRSCADVGGQLRCKSLEITFTDLTTGTITQKERIQFDNYTKTIDDVCIYDLAHYGIPPPGDDTDAPYKWTFWVGVGLICISASVLLRWLARKK